MTIELGVALAVVTALVGVTTFLLGRRRDAVDEGRRLAQADATDAQLARDVAALRERIDALAERAMGPESVARLLGQAQASIRAELVAAIEHRGEQQQRLIAAERTAAISDALGALHATLAARIDSATSALSTRIEATRERADGQADDWARRLAIIEARVERLETSIRTVAATGRTITGLTEAHHDKPGTTPPGGRRST